ncbi:MaoC family dehydratase [Chloroflexota bacterium]
MVFKRGEKDFYKAEIGDEFEPLEMTITKEMAMRNCWSIDDYNPWYMEDSPWGGRIVSPMQPVIGQNPSVWGYYAPARAALHTQQEFEFINPLKIGKKITVSGKLVDKYVKRGRTYIVSEHLVTDEDGNKICVMRKTGCSSFVDPPEK